MQIIVRHPLLTDAVSAGVAVCQGIIPKDLSLPAEIHSDRDLSPLPAVETETEATDIAVTDLEAAVPDADAAHTDTADVTPVLEENAEEAAGAKTADTVESTETATEQCESLVTEPQPDTTVQLSSERDIAFAYEERAIAVLQEIIADTPECRVGLACYGRRVVGVAAMVPAKRFGLQTNEQPVRARELRYFKILDQYYDDALAQRLFDFVTVGIEPAQIWLPRTGTAKERAFLRTQGFTSDATWVTVEGIDYARLVR